MVDNMRKYLLLFACLLVLVIGCTQKAIEKTSTETNNQKEIVSETPPITGDAEVISSEISGMDEINSDLDTAELNNLEKELAEITW
jgi:hypothetical protein